MTNEDHADCRAGWHDNPGNDICSRCGADLNPPFMPHYASTEGFPIDDGTEVAPDGYAWALLVAYDFTAHVALHRTRKGALGALRREIEANVHPDDMSDDIEAMVDLACGVNDDLYGLAVKLVRVKGDDA